MFWLEFFFGYLCRICKRKYNTNILSVALFAPFGKLLHLQSSLDVGNLQDFSINVNLMHTYYNLGKQPHAYGGLDCSYSHVAYFTG